MVNFHLESQFHFFIIWPNGFDHIGDILKILRSEKDLQILTIRKHTFKNMHDFVFDLYGCDSVPLRHLKSKLTYLYNLPPEVINIFVENFNPQETVMGSVPFRKKQCQYIVSIKNKIRNLYNPKHRDANFQILPLDKGVSHEHVVHASDREEQVDYYLKYLGIKNGISYLKNDNDGLIFKKPFHIARPKRYSFKDLPISLLLATILDYENNQVVKKAITIKDTPHYKALCQDTAIYLEYLSRYQYARLCDDYSLERFLELSSLELEKLRTLPPILVKPNGDRYLILDGVHRAAAALFRNFETINSVIFEQ